MIRMTATQREVLSALARLRLRQDRGYTETEVRDERLKPTTKLVDVNSVYLRTTANALRQLAQIVPRVVVDDGGWRLTHVGAVVAQVQLGVT